MTGGDRGGEVCVEGANRGIDRGRDDRLKRASV